MKKVILQTHLGPVPLTIRPMNRFQVKGIDFVIHGTFSGLKKSPPDQAGESLWRFMSYTVTHVKSGYAAYQSDGKWRQVKAAFLLKMDDPDFYETVKKWDENI